MRNQEPQDFVGSYGNAWREGVISEHLPAFVKAGGVVRPAASGSGLVWAVVDGHAFRVLCSDLVEVWTEDGPVSGRCGADALVDGSCEGHAQERAGWLAASEAEKADWERQQEVWA